MWARLAHAEYCMGAFLDARNLCPRSFSTICAAHSGPPRAMPVKASQARPCTCFSSGWACIACLTRPIMPSSTICIALSRAPSAMRAKASHAETCTYFSSGWASIACLTRPIMPSSTICAALSGVPSAMRAKASQAETCTYFSSRCSAACSQTAWTFVPVLSCEGCQVKVVRSFALWGEPKLAAQPRRAQADSTCVSCISISFYASSPATYATSDSFSFPRRCCAGLPRTSIHSASHLAMTAAVAAAVPAVWGGSQTPDPQRRPADVAVSPLSVGTRPFVGPICLCRWFAHQRDCPPSDYLERDRPFQLVSERAHNLACRRPP